MESLQINCSLYTEFLCSLKYNFDTVIFKNHNRKMAIILFYLQEIRQLTTVTQRGSFINPITFLSKICANLYLEDTCLPVYLIHTYLFTVVTFASKTNIWVYFLFSSLKCSPTGHCHAKTTK